MSEEFATRTELNGLGTRLNGLEKLEPRVNRSETDIQKIFALNLEDSKEHVQLRQEIGYLGITIQKSISDLVIKCLIGISVPTILILIQMVMKR